MDALETILSVIIGIFAGIAIGIGFAVRAVVLLLLYLLGQIIGLVCPPLKYKIRMRYLLRDATREKNSRLRTGLFSRVELKGGAADRPFVSMKRCMEQYQDQKKRRSALSGQTELKEIFRRVDRLYGEFLKQFYIAAGTIRWKNVDAYRGSEQPAFANLNKAVSGMETLLSEHEKTISRALSPDASGLPDDADFSQELAYLKDFNAVQDEAASEQQTQQML